MMKSLHALSVRVSVVAMTAGLLLLTPVVARAQVNLLTNPSFEAVDASAAPFYIRNFSSTPGWTQLLDGVDLIHNNYTQGPAVLVDASDGVQFLDMNQAGAIGGIQQVVSALTGTTYRLTLDTTAWATNSIGGIIGYQLFDPTSAAILAQGSFTDSVGGAWVTRTLDAVAASNQIGVRIQGIQAAQAGMGLDNVRLSVAAAAPEPSTLPLFAPAVLMGLTLARRRTNRRRAK
jgi:hypothetical protein